MGKIFYAIDMGAPSRTASGFFCWKYDQKNNVVTSFSRFEGWKSCVSSIVADSLKHEVHLTIEAALWGMCDKDDAWIRRFELNERKSKNNLFYTERPWYTGAGASTGLMAQEFLFALVRNNLKRKIFVYESYISGLVIEGTNKGIAPKKPKAMVTIKSHSKHSFDALEGLLLSTERHGVSAQEITTVFKKENMDLLNITGWPALSKARIDVRKNGNKMFALGVLRDNDLFDFKLGEILFTKRAFKF